MFNNMNLGDVCKWFENNQSPDIMMPLIPTIIRLDGKSFHTWTKGLNRPFDEGLLDLMTDTTIALVKETNAIVGYTQSDEITLVLNSTNVGSDIYFAGEKKKILSCLSSFATAYFNNVRPKFLPNHDRLALFDCRVYQVPNLDWAYKQLLWRERDATKNSISMVAQANFPHKSLDGLNGSQLQEKLFSEAGINWNNLPVRQKRGTYVKAKQVDKSFAQMSQEEQDKLPLMHNARRNPDLVFTRRVIDVVEFPILSQIPNPVEVVFG
ncbi:MAG: tRNA(His) guanylyltransferase Thg1 family protein [Patescibacteria group bacterium]